MGRPHAHSPSIGIDVGKDGYDIRLAEDESAGITTIPTATTVPFIATPIRGGLRLTNPAGHELRICDAAGRLLTSSSQADITLQLSPGIYIVTAGAFSQKVNITK